MLTFSENNTLKAETGREAEERIGLGGGLLYDKGIYNIYINYFIVIQQSRDRQGVILREAIAAVLKDSLEVQLPRTQRGETARDKYCV